MNTSCQKCIFAEKDEQENQIDCWMGRISLYTDQKVDIIKEGDPSYFLIKNRICNFCRANDSEWNNDLTLEDKKIEVRKEVQLKLHAIVICGPNSTTEEVLITAKSLENQKLPIYSHFLSTVDGPKISKILKRNFGSDSNLVWNLRLIFEEGSKLNRGEIADRQIMELSPKDCQFYILIDPGVELQENFSELLDNYLNDKLGQFIYLNSMFYKNEQGKELEIGPIVHTAIHKSLGGNSKAQHDFKNKNDETQTINCNSIYDKIKLLTIDQNNEYLIKDLIEIIYGN